jgi:hypothetical protein
VISKAANETVNILTKVSAFQFSAFKSNLITIAQNIKKAALAKAGKKEAEQLIDLGIEVTDIANRLFVAVSATESKSDINNLRKEYLDSLSALLMALKEIFKTRCSRCKGVIVGKHS